MLKSELKTLIENSVSAAINEVQMTAFPKIGNAPGDSTIWNRTKRDVRNITNALPETISDIGEIEDLCTYLDSINYDELKDKRFKTAFKEIVAGARKKFSKTLKKFEEKKIKVKEEVKTVAPEDDNEKLTLQTPPPQLEEAFPDLPEELFPNTADLYERAITQAIVANFSKFEQFFANIETNGAPKEIIFTAKDQEKIVNEFKSIFSALVHEIKTVILERNPFPGNQVKESYHLNLDFGEIVAIIKGKIEELGPMFPIAFDDELVDKTFAENLPDSKQNQTLYLPALMTKKQKGEIEDTELDSYIIENAAQLCFKKAVESSRKLQMLEKEKDLFIMLAVDYLAEKIPNAADSIPTTLIGDFRQRGGEEFLLDIAVMFNDDFHGGIEVRDLDNLMFFMNECILEICEKLKNRKAISEPPVADKTVDVALQFPPIYDVTEKNLDTRIEEYANWANSLKKPGAQFLFKLFAAAGVALNTYGRVLSRQQKEVILTLFELIRQVHDQRDEGSKRQAIRVEKLVEAILTAVKPIDTKPETQAAEYIRKLEIKADTFESTINNFVIEVGEISSLQKEGEIREKDYKSIKQQLDEANDEAKNTQSILEQLALRLAATKVGTTEFTNIVNEISSMNCVFQTQQVRVAGLQAKSLEIENNWAESVSKIDDLEKKMIVMNDLQTEYSDFLKQLRSLT